MATLFTGCAFKATARKQQDMKINCTLISIPPNNLPESVLPAKNIKVPEIEGEIPGLAHLDKLLKKFNRSGDKLIAELFGPLFKGRRFSIVVIATQGIPEPYDAWTGEYKGQEAVFFNMSLWPEKDLDKAGLAVIKHEIAHVLLAELLKKTDEDNPLNLLDYITLNEGIAHFIGYPRDQASMLSENVNRWKEAEKALENAKVMLSTPKLSNEERDSLIQKSNTGTYWGKYAAISGMFRAANIYKIKGATGLRDCVLRGNLPLK